MLKFWWVIGQKLTLPMPGERSADFGRISRRIRNNLGKFCYVFLSYSGYSVERRKAGRRVSLEYWETRVQSQKIVDSNDHSWARGGVVTWQKIGENRVRYIGAYCILLDRAWAAEQHSMFTFLKYRNFHELFSETFFTSGFDAYFEWVSGNIQYNVEKVFYGILFSTDYPIETREDRLRRSLVNRETGTRKLENRWKSDFRKTKEIEISCILLDRARAAEQNSVFTFLKHWNLHELLTKKLFTSRSGAHFGRFSGRV